MSILLEVEGYNVISSSDTVFAKRKLHEKGVDLVMLDLRLKDEDGESMCAYIKGHADLKHIPVVLVSANADLAQIKEDCGADGFINKPFDMNGFLTTVSAYA